MDQSWINFLCTTNEYENGVEEFLEFANMNVPNNNGKFYCPCVNCLNERKLPTDVIQEHVLCDGFLNSYTKWIWHGELIDMPSVDVSEAKEVDLEMDKCHHLLSIRVSVRSPCALLRVVLKGNHRSWDEYLPHIEFAYNRVVHNTTKLSLLRLFMALTLLHH